MLSAGVEVATNTALQPVKASWTLRLGLGWRGCMELWLPRAGPEKNLPPTHLGPAAGAS